MNLLIKGTTLLDVSTYAGIIQYVRDVEDPQCLLNQ